MSTVRGRDALVQLGVAYDQLLQDTGAPITCRRPWLQAWIDSYPGWRPWVIAVPGPGGRLDAAAALAVGGRGPVLRVHALGHGPSDEARLPARSPAAAEELARRTAAALGALRRPWQLHLDQLPEGCPVATALQPLLPLAEVVEGDGIPRVDLDPAGDEKRHLSKNARQSERTARNRLAAAGREVAEQWTRDPVELEHLLPELLDVHRRRDLALGRRPDHDDPRAAAFYRRVLRVHALRGEVELLTVRIDGELAAYTLGFRDGRTFCVWDARLSPAHASFSAGRLANASALRHVLADPGCDVLDWMRGEEPYKLSSATRVDRTVQLRAWSSTAARLPEAGWTRLKDLRRTNAVAGRVAAALGRPAPPER